MTLLLSWYLPFTILKLSPRRKSVTSLFEKLNHLLTKFLCHPRGLFADSKIRYLDDMDNYLGDVDTIPTICVHKDVVHTRLRG